MIPSVDLDTLTFVSDFWLKVCSSHWNLVPQLEFTGVPGPLLEWNLVCVYVSEIRVCLNPNTKGEEKEIYVRIGLDGKWKGVIYLYNYIFLWN